MELILRYLGVVTPDFKFGRPKEVILQIIKRKKILKVILQVDPARFLQIGIMYLEICMKLNIPMVGIVY